MANSKPRRQRPTSRLDRARLCEVNRLLNSRGLTDERRAELEAERDRLSPVLQPPTREELERLIERVEAKRENGFPSPDGSPAGEIILKPDAPNSSTPVDLARQALARRLDAAKEAIAPQLKAKKLDIDDGLIVVAEQHAKFGYQIWTGRDDWDEIPEDGKAEIVLCQVRAWRSEPVFERPTWSQATWLFFMGRSATEKLRERAMFDKNPLTPEQRKNLFERLKVKEWMDQPLPDMLLDPEPELAASETVTVAGESPNLPAAPPQGPEPPRPPCESSLSSTGQAQVFHRGAGGLNS